ncbi:hypothetical protein BC936DRAFT_140061 [Jimgerdemannia flammicorona]|uniref:NUC153 domain-containing protein n=1 Tax=Jimgerdemannia flammicorona TaxID=994334 RepID=A0A433B4P4_9FUNG|nr:hypothetical protein BC936DRAFT_140061 [Jimgerdemannia flammicorona]
MTVLIHHPSSFPPVASKRAQKKQKSRQHRALDSHQHAELDLLMADSTGAGDGFDMREVLRREKLRGKKGKKARRAGEEEDDFEINVTDPRFEAVMDSHHFAIDPTNPQYKKTKAMERLQAERRKRQAEGGGQKRKVEVEVGFFFFFDRELAGRIAVLGYMPDIFLGHELDQLLLTLASKPFCHRPYRPRSKGHSRTPHYPFLSIR